MSSEICPFCGKSFKRLKSHLPHCKSAKGSKTFEHEEPQLISRNKAKSAAKNMKSTENISLDRKVVEQKVKSATIPQTNKKTKLKLSDKIKMAAAVSSQASVEPVQLSPTRNKKEMNVQSQIESKSLRNFEKLNLVSSTHILPDSVEMTNPKLGQNNKELFDKADFKKVNPTELAKKSTKSTIKKTIKKDNLQIRNQPTDLKKDENEHFTEKSNSNKTKINLNIVKMNLKDHFRTEDQTYLKTSAEIDPWNKGETRITVEDVRSTLRRAKQNGVSKKNSLIHKIEQNFEIMNQNKAEQSLVKSQRDEPSQLMTLKMSKNEITASKSEDFFSKLSEIESKDRDFPLRSDSLRDGLRMDLHTRGITAFSAPLTTILEAEVSAKGLRKDLVPNLSQKLEKNVSEMKEMSDNGRQDGRRSTRDALAQQRLGQVSLRELPDWLVLKSPRRPRDVVDMAQRGWHWYYRRYIDVRRGGVGGVAMLLAGYCVLSYIWTYPHLKRDRWRKYH